MNILKKIIELSNQDSLAVLIKTKDHLDKTLKLVNKSKMINPDDEKRNLIQSMKHYKQLYVCFYLDIDNTIEAIGHMPGDKYGRLYYNRNGIPIIESEDMLFKVTKRKLKQY